MDAGIDRLPAAPSRAQDNLLALRTDRKSNHMRPSMAWHWGFKTRLTEAV